MVCLRLDLTQAENLHVDTHVLESRLDSAKRKKEKGKEREIRIKSFVDIHVSHLLNTNQGTFHVFYQLNEFLLLLLFLRYRVS